MERQLSVRRARSLAPDSGELARDYERISAARQFLSGKRLAADLAIAAGERVLDVDCGSGLLAEPPFDRHRLARDNVIFRVGAAEMRALLEATGFVPTLIEMRTTEQVYPSAEAAIRYSEASSFGNFMGHLPSELRPQARAAMARRLAAVAGPEGIVRHGKPLVALALRR